MKKNLIGLVAMSITLFGVSSANASIIKIETGFSNATSQVDAAAYKAVVEAAVASPGVGYGSALPAIYDNISNHDTIGGVITDIAFKSTVDFGLASASTMQIRAGVDFGRGGAIFVDGVAQDFKTNDMWWAGSYADPNQIFSISLSLGAGNHTLNLYGLEGCCDGGQQAQYSLGDSAEFTTFSAEDGLNVAAVPEPETYGMMLMGLGMIGFMARRRRNDQA